MSDSTKDVGDVANANTSETASNVETVATSNEDSTNSTEETTTLSSEAAKLVEKFEASSDEKREELVSGLAKAKQNNSLRGYQKEALETLTDTFNVKVETKDEGLSEGELRELDVYRRKEAISAWAQKTGKNITPDKALADKNFIKTWLREDLRGISDVSKRAEFALYEVYGQGVDSEKREKANNAVGAVKGGAKKVESKNPLLDAIMKS